MARQLDARQGNEENGQATVLIGQKQGAPRAAQERKQAWDSEFQRKAQSTQSAQNKLLATQELMKAVDKGDLAAARKALEQGGDPNATTESVGMSSSLRDFSGIREWNSLYVAIVHSNVEMGRLLLEHGADPNVGNPLMGMIYNFPKSEQEQLPIFSLLLEKGANPNQDHFLQDIEETAKNQRVDQPTRDWNAKLARMMRDSLVKK